MTFGALEQCDWSGVLRLWEKHLQERNLDHLAERGRMREENRERALERARKAGIAPLYAGLRSKHYDRERWGEMDETGRAGVSGPQAVVSGRRTQ